MNTIFRPALLMLALMFSGSSFAVAINQQYDQNLIRSLLGSASEAYIEELNKEPKENGLIKVLSRAISAFQKGDRKQAMVHFAQARHSHHLLPPAELMMSRLLRASKQSDHAKLMLVQAAQTYPTHPEAYLDMADMAIAEGNMKSAKRFLDQILRLGPPKDWGKRQNQAFAELVNAGRVLVAEATDDWAQAEAILQDWLHRNPENTGVRARLGRALLAQGKESKAMPHFVQTAQFSSPKQPTEFYIAHAWLTLGDKAQAQTWFEKAKLKGLIEH